jgi:quercetin dioxygenase-like cupin family protein
MEPIAVIARPERSVAILVSLDDVVMTESRYAAGQRGPDPHVHRLHADCFYVLDGLLTLALADGDRVLEAGSWALVPPHVVHAFRNDGPDEARFLNLHAPGMGFDRYLLDTGATNEVRAGLAGFDQHPAPADGGLDPDRVLVRRAGEAETVEVAGNSISFLANADEALDAMAVIEGTAAPGFTGPPLHVHDRMFDIFYVLAGRLAVTAGASRRELCSGDVAVVAPGTPHTFSNPFGAPARFLDVYSPGGFEQYLRDAARALPQGGPLDPAALGALAARYDFRVV